MRKISLPSQRKLRNYYQSNDSGRFVGHCLGLIRKGYALQSFFAGAEDIYAETVEEGLALQQELQSGFIYLATNPVYGRDLYKIGLTRKAPEERMETLVTSGVLGKFVLVGQWPSLDVDRSEARCHDFFASCRVDGEFFHSGYQPLMNGIGTVMAEEESAITALRQLTLSYD